MATTSHTDRQGDPVSPYAGDLIADRDVIRRICSLPHRLRRFELSQARGPLWVFRASLAAPLRAARAARLAVRRFGRAARDHLGVSTARQFMWLWWLNLRHLYDANSVYRYQLFSRKRALPQPLYLPQSVAWLLFRSIVPIQSHEPAAILTDKRRFASWCRETGIGTPQILMEFENGRISGSDLGDHLEPACDLFAKWATGGGGADTQRWKRTGKQWVDADSRQWDFSEIVEALAARSVAGSVVLQPCLVNHPALSDLSPNALSTIRIMTTRRPREEPRFLAGVLRMGTGNSTADNFAQGGIASAIDLKTGILAVAISNDDLNRSHEYEVHPDTGARISGRQVPYWSEAIDLAVDAHSKIGEIPCIGWDVAVLESGPLLVEGNWSPCIKFLQVTTRTPLLITEFARTYSAWLDEPECAFDDRWLFERRKWSPLDGTVGAV